MMKDNIVWHKFTPLKGANRQKLPREKKYVLVRLRNPDVIYPDPIVVGYLKFHAGVKSEPYFITPSASFNAVASDDRVIEWCDCLPDNFNWPKRDMKLPTK